MNDTIALAEGRPAQARHRNAVLRFLAALGPGLVTGAADDDPSGIGTYSQVGAQFGYQMGWTMLFSYPLMTAIQEIAARIGSTTGHGIAANLRKHYPRWVLDAVIIALLVANVINLGADIAAMGDAAALLLPGPMQLWVVLIAAVSVAAEAWLSYARYARILKWITLALLAYVATAIVAHVHWSEALAGAILPRLSVGGAAATALVAVLGTTISPYLFFWQSSQEVEELHRRNHKPLCVAARAARPELSESAWTHSLAWPFPTSLRCSSSLQSRRHLTLTEFTRSTPACRLHRRWRLLPAGLQASSSRPGSLEPACSRCRCLPDRRVRRLRERFVGEWGSTRSRCGARILRRHRRRYAAGRCHRLLADQSDEGALLVCCHERCARRAAHAGHDADFLKPKDYGQSRHRLAHARRRVDGNSRHVRRRYRNVCDLMN